MNGVNSSADEGQQSFAKQGTKVNHKIETGARIEQDEAVYGDLKHAEKDVGSDEDYSEDADQAD